MYHIDSLDHFALKPPRFPIDDAFLPVSVPTNNRLKNDCVVLAISVLEKLSYQYTLLETYGAFTTDGVLIDDIEIVLSRLGYCRLDFLFKMSLSELWRAGFFDTSLKAPKMLVCLGKEGGGHSIAFNRLFWGEFLPSDEWHVVTVFSKGG